MFQKIIIAFLSTLLFSTALAFLSYTPQAEWEENVYHFSFTGLLTIFALYSGPVFLLGGVPLSLLIDRINRGRHFRSKAAAYLFNLLLYALAAVPATLVFVLVLAEGPPADQFREFAEFLLFGACGSLLFYHLTLLAKWIAPKKGHH